MITAKVHGGAALTMKLKALQAEVKSALKEASLAGAEPIHDEAERLAPRRKTVTKIGHLADHIEIEVAKSTATSCLVRIGPDKDHWYGRFSETGTVKMAAKPYLRPAIDTQGDEALEAFSKEMRARLKIGPSVRSLRA
ncbi:MAG: HK97-gp10 family putative phage morphogenesis protein [bacterium]